MSLAAAARPAACAMIQHVRYPRPGTWAQHRLKPQHPTSPGKPKWLQQTTPPEKIKVATNHVSAVRFSVQILKQKKGTKKENTATMHHGLAVMCITAWL